MLQGLSQDPSPFQTAASTSATVSQKDGTASTSGPLPAQHIGPDANTSPISSTTAALLGLQSAGNSNASAAAIGLSRGGQTSGPLPAQRTGPDTNTSPIQLGAGILPDAANQTGAAQPNGPQMIQNQYGQVITIYQGTGNEEEAGVSGSPGTTTATGTESKNLDFKNNYIHSHLPNEAPQNAAAQGESRQTDNSALDQQPEISNALNTETDAAATMESLQPQKGPMTFGQDNLPFMVSPQRPTSQPGFTHAAMEPPMYRLPSGTVVPEGTVVEQMVAHLSVNKRLETGTVNLRLHPQELGELRLEIKVEQDNIKAHIVAQNPQAQEMIDRHLPRLREALEQQGLNLQQVEVTVAANDNTRGEQFQENSTWQQPSRSPRNRMDARFTLEMDENFPKEPEATTSNLSVVA
ncbi:Flagellar hook-length control protein-like, C-terminal domain protein [Desulfobulbus propionicus DSM 2032]|uniref:Flagellar hook-length control protein-like, C-terminal domain protein n=2 Tax=Desulfobulbus propionicus TaxID=894 RepID=A0A7U4DPP4_DESPD|nr:Flagellar hook-length control protein-like, C-terminal domain protein [Desulfobulbus propionicus DSM 2032]